MLTKNAIFMSIDQKFLPCIRICLSSIEYFYKEHPEIIIVHADLTDDQMVELSNITTNITFLKNECEKIWPVMDHLKWIVNPEVFYVRFLLRKDRRFDKYDSILYLDSDTVIIWSLDLIFKKKLFYMAKEAYLWEDQLFYNFKDKELQKTLSKDWIFVENREWNAGVFLLPKDLRTRENYLEFIEILDRYSKRIKWADQSIINIWMYKHELKLYQSYIYNYQHRFIIRKWWIPKTTKIVHFNWIDSSIRKNCMKKFFNIIKTKSDIKDYVSFYLKYING